MNPTKGVTLGPKRLPDWQMRLSNHLSSVAAKGFDWKDNDCAKWTANAVKAMTGKDVMAGMRGYRSEDGAKKALAKHKFKTTADFLRKHFEEIAPGLAMPGDIAVLENDGLGIVQGQYVYRPGANGVVMSPIEQVKTAFRVEF